jgi:hypothetical protein
VPFAREAQHFAALARGTVRARRSRWLPPAIAAATKDENLAGEPLDDLVVRQGARPLAMARLPAGFGQQDLAHADGLRRALAADCGQPCRTC